MPTPDLTVEIISIKDQGTPQRDGSITKEKVVVFYLGKHGPFTERFPGEGFNVDDAKARIARLRDTLEALHS